MAEGCEMKDCPFDPVEWGKLMQKLDSMHEDVVGIKEAVQRQNGRVRKLEVWRGYIIGIGAAITFIITSVLKWVVK